MQHEPWCDKDTHTDPAIGCAGPTVDTHGLTSWTSLTSDGQHRAYLETRAVQGLSPEALDEMAAHLHELARLISH